MKTVPNQGSYFQKVLVGVDDSLHALNAFDYAIHYAKEQHLGLVIVSVWDEDALNTYEALDNDFVQAQHKKLEAQMAEYRKEAEARGVAHVETIIVDGKPGKTIVKEVIPQVQPDLLIIGAKSKQPEEDKDVAEMGSQADYMIRHSPISVLVIR